MNVVRHHCDVPGCDWHHDQPLPILTATATWDTMVAGASAAAQDAADAWRAHQADHYLPEPATTEVPTLNSLTDADGNPAVAFGPDVIGLILLTSNGHAQIVGRDGVNPMALGEALVNTGRTLLDAEDGNPPFQSDDGEDPCCLLYREHYAADHEVGCPRRTREGQ